MLNREELIDELSDALQDRHDMDVPWSSYADAVVTRLEALGVLSDARRWRTLRENKGQEMDQSSGPETGIPKDVVIRLNAADCARYLESGAPDFPGTLDAILDAEIVERQIAL